MRIGKIVFGADTFHYGLELCLHKASKSAIIVDETTVWACDILLVSMFWFMDIFLFERFLRRSGLKKKTRKPVIIIGGTQATITPQLCAEMADYVFIGDGDDHLGGILDDIEAGRKPTCTYLYIKNDQTIPAAAECQPVPFIMRKNDDGKSTSRIEIARGCKYKCPFCVLSALKSYREVPAGDICDLLETTWRKGPYSLFAPERTMHSGWPEIEEKIRELKIRNYGSDVRLEHLHKINNGRVTVGIEGISYRLRQLIKKPYTEKYIIEKLGDFVKRQKRLAYIKLYFIADLPGECETDWQELWELFHRIESEKWSRKATFIPILNPLSPKPGTTLANVIIHPYRDYSTTWLDFLRKNGEHWGFRILETRVWGPWRRVLDAIVHRGGENAYRIVERMPNKYLARKPPVKIELTETRQLVADCGSYGITREILGIED